MFAWSGEQVQVPLRSGGRERCDVRFDNTLVECWRLVHDRDLLLRVLPDVDLCGRVHNVDLHIRAFGRLGKPPE